MSSPNSFNCSFMDASLEQAQASVFTIREELLTSPYSSLS